MAREADLYVTSSKYITKSAKCHTSKRTSFSLQELKKVLLFLHSLFCILDTSIWFHKGEVPRFHSCSQFQNSLCSQCIPGTSLNQVSLLSNEFFLTKLSYFKFESQHPKSQNIFKDLKHSSQMLFQSLMFILNTLHN